jgi:hypothetical protein
VLSGTSQQVIARWDAAVAGLGDGGLLQVVPEGGVLEVPPWAAPLAVPRAITITGALSVEGAGAQDTWGSAAVGAPAGSTVISCVEGAQSALLIR